MKISTILDNIDHGQVALPEFQRGYVWNRDQVRGLMYSLYRKHPVGSLLVWLTKTEDATARGDGGLAPGSVKLLLDGQQRITSLYGIVRGKPPKFFDGNPQTFTGLHFNCDDEVFEFYMPMKMKDNPLWINVTEFMQKGAGSFIGKFYRDEKLTSKADIYSARLNELEAVKNIDLHIDEVSGADKTVDVVVDIFNRVNSGGTKLSKGDLALAKICAEWSEARTTMKDSLSKYRRIGFNFRLEWLLRIVNSVLTGESLFTALKEVNTEKFKMGLNKAENYIDTMINLISSRLGLDHDRVLGSRSSFPLMCRYLEQTGGNFPDFKDRDKMLYWYIHTILWGRYAGSTESILTKDLAAISDGKNPLDALIEELRQNRGDLRVNDNDFRGWSRGNRFYPLLYMMTRACKAKDWQTGVELTQHMLGRLNKLQVHHIFPKAVLYKHGYERRDVNAVANFTFLTQDTNLDVLDRNPQEYLAKIAEKDEKLISSHWIPLDRDLWKVENYMDFLRKRRELLAEAANGFLDNLYSGDAPETDVTDLITKKKDVQVPGGVESEEEEKLLEEVNSWLEKQGLPEGEFQYEITDDATGDPLAVLDLAWPDGLQPGYSKPVALLIDEGYETEEAANKAGYLFFTDVDLFRSYVDKDILAKDITEPEQYDRSYWEARSSKETVGMCGDVLNIITSFDPDYELNYNKYHIGLTKKGRSNNFVVLNPKRKYLSLSIRHKQSDEAQKQLIESGLNVMGYDFKNQRYRIRLQGDGLKNNHDILEKLIQESYETYGK